MNIVCRNSVYKPIFKYISLKINHSKAVFTKQREVYCKPDGSDCFTSSLPYPVIRELLLGLNSDVMVVLFFKIKLN